nr:ankyrin repeat [Pandoravirus massiliensis]
MDGVRAKPAPAVPLSWSTKARPMRDMLDPRKRRSGGRQSHRKASLRDLPNELVAAIASWLDHRNIGAALVASRRFHVIDQRRIYDAMTPVSLASRGCLHGIVYKHGLDPWLIDMHCLDAAVAGGHIDVVRWIVDASTGGACPTRVLIEAARSGHVAIMRWAIEERGATVVMCALRAAALGGHTDAVRCLYEGRHRSLWWYDRVLCWAARSGRLDTLRFVHEQCARARRGVRYALADAVSAGAVDCVEWLADRCETASHAKQAFRESLTCLHRDCGIAILARWPEAADKTTLYRWEPAIKSSELITLDRLNAAIAPSAASTNVQSIVCALVEGRLSSSAAYDALFAKCLSVYVDACVRQRMPFSFGASETCDDVFAWCAQRDTSDMGGASFVRKVLVGRRTAFYEMAHQRLCTMGSSSLCHIWMGIGEHAEAMERMWQWIAPSGAQTVAQCDAERGDFINAAQALLTCCQSMADDAAKTDNTVALDWLQAKCGASARCTNLAIRHALSRGHVALAHRLFADGTHLRHCRADAQFGVPTDDHVCDSVTINDAAEGNHRAILELLHARGTLRKGWFAYAAASTAIDAGHVSLAAWLEKTFDVALGEHSMRMAADRRDLCAIRFLLHAGAEADLNAETVPETSAFYHAIESGSLAIAKALYRRGPRIRCAYDEIGIATDRNYDDIASWLREEHAGCKCEARATTHATWMDEDPLYGDDHLKGVDYNSDDDMPNHLSDSDDDD